MWNQKLSFRSFINQGGAQAKSVCVCVQVSVCLCVYVCVHSYTSTDWLTAFSKYIYLNLFIEALSSLAIVMLQNFRWSNLLDFMKTTLFHAVLNYWTLSSSGPCHERHHTSLHLYCSLPVLSVAWVCFHMLIKFMTLSQYNYVVQTLPPIYFSIQL